jgi:hypothetical protein
MRIPFLRFPAKAGTHFSATETVEKWTLAFAGERWEGMRQPHSQPISSAE